MKEEKATLIIPNKKEKKDNEEFKIVSIIFKLILGIILLTNSSQAVIIVFYLIGAIFLLIGICNLISFYKIKKEFHIEKNSKLAFGITIIFIGISILTLSSAIEFFLRFIIGILLMYFGFKNIASSVYITIIIGIIFIAMGLYTIIAENIVFQIVGILIIISSILDIMNLLKQKK